ncbi:MAG: hypothetical protein AB8B79_10600 [Granulosicoccus sp.]
MKSVASNNANDLSSLGSNIRNLDWFVNTFESYSRSMETHIGRRFEIDEEALRLTYFDWIEQFDSDPIKQYAKDDYWDCVDYIAALGLTGLIQKNPLSLSSDEFVGDQLDPDKLVRLFGLKLQHVDDIPDIIEFWPEGFVYVCFCITFINNLELQKTGKTRRLNDEAFDLRRFWWTFKENVQEDDAAVVHFFDRIMGNDPTPSKSNALEARRAMKGQRYSELSSASSPELHNDGDQKN